MGNLVEEVLSHKILARILAFGYTYWLCSLNAWKAKGSGVSHGSSCYLRTDGTIAWAEQSV